MRINVKTIIIPENYWTIETINWNKYWKSLKKSKGSYIEILMTIFIRIIINISIRIITITILIIISVINVLLKLYNYKRN